MPALLHFSLRSNDTKSNLPGLLVSVIVAMLGAASLVVAILQFRGNGGQEQRSNDNIELGSIQADQGMRTAC